jgi:hypothetical protein
MENGTLLINLWKNIPGRRLGEKNGGKIWQTDYGFIFCDGNRDFPLPVFGVSGYLIA